MGSSGTSIRLGGDGSCRSTSCRSGAESGTRVQRFVRYLESRSGRWLLDIEPTSRRILRETTSKLRLARILRIPLQPGDVCLGKNDPRATEGQDRRFHRRFGSAARPMAWLDRPFEREAQRSVFIANVESQGQLTSPGSLGIRPAGRLNVRA